MKARPSKQSRGSVTALGYETHIGIVRSSNQDSFCALLAPDAPLGSDALLAVADGMGGRPAGDVASAMAIERLLSHLQSASEQPVKDDGQRAGLLGEAMHALNRDVFHAAIKPETRGMGTTLTVAMVAGSSLVIGHVGDSRLYLLRGDQLHQPSSDHNWAEEEIRRGHLTRDAARTHPGRNMLTRAIGTTPQVEVDVLALPVQEGDTVLLCSDGLHGLVPDEEISGVLQAQPPPEAAKTLVDMANEHGGSDNVTVVIARMGGVTEGGALIDRLKRIFRG